MPAGFPLAFLPALCQHVVMVCIYCGSKTRVSNSRAQKRLRTTWRRRACESCGAVFTTIETPDLNASLRVRLADGSLRPFERDVLLVSIVQSLGHRKDAVTAASALTNTIVVNVLKTAQGAVLDRSNIIRETFVALQHFDAVAATYYAAYHKT